MTPIDPRALRTAFGTFMTGVTVVTGLDRTGQPVGFTANSFTSVSLDPPLVLVCLANTSQNYDTLTQAQGFAVNVLAETQIELSNTFARPGVDRFADVGWRAGPQGSPVLDGVSAWFDCKMHKTVAAGDHVILIGEVCAFDHTAHPGLGYARGAYVTPSTATQALENAANLVVSALVVRDDEIVLVEDETGALALPQARVGRAGTNRTLNTLLAALELKAEPGFIYSVFEDTERGCQHISYLCPVGAGVPARGRFVALDRVGDHGLTDAAVTSMLARYSAERRLGNFGIYVGTQESGTVRPVT